MTHASDLAQHRRILNKVSYLSRASPCSLRHTIWALKLSTCNLQLPSIWHSSRDTSRWAHRPTRPCQCHRCRCINSSPHMRRVQHLIPICKCRGSKCNPRLFTDILNRRLSHRFKSSLVRIEFPLRLLRSTSTSILSRFNCRLNQPRRESSITGYWTSLTGVKSGVNLLVPRFYFYSMRGSEVLFAACGFRLCLIVYGMFTRS